MDRYLPNVANVTGNSLPSRFPDKVRSLRGSERAPLPLSGDVGAVALLNRVFASFRLLTRPPCCERLSTPIRRDLTRNFCNSGLSCYGGLLYGEEFLWSAHYTPDNTRSLWYELMHFCETKFSRDRNFIMQVSYEGCGVSICYRSAVDSLIQELKYQKRETGIKPAI